MWGYNGMYGAGTGLWGAFVIIFLITLLIDAILLGIWLWQRIQDRR